MFRYAHKALAVGLLIVISSACAITPTLPPTNTSTNSVRALDQTDREMIAHFSSIVHSFFKIVQDPENREVVGTNVATIATHIASVIAQEVQNNARRTPGAPIDEKELQERVTRLLTPFLTVYIERIVRNKK